MNPYLIGAGALLGGLQGQREDQQAAQQNLYSALSAYYGRGGAAPVQTKGVLGSMFAGGLSGADMGMRMGQYEAGMARDNALANYYSSKAAALSPKSMSVDTSGATLDNSIFADNNQFEPQLDFAREPRSFGLAGRKPQPYKLR